MNLGRITAALLMVLPGAAVVWLSFDQGGFFPDGPALVAVILLQVLILRILLEEQPLRGMNPAVVVVAGALGLLALWQLLSATWSDAPARALIEFDRTLLYLLAVVLFGSIGTDRRRLNWLIWGLAAALTAVCVAGLASRVLPETFPTEPNVANNRLAHPLTYWNTLGLMASIGIVLCVHLASRARGPWLPRILGAAAVPILATTLLFTFSRGSILAGATALLLYVAVGRPRGILSGLLATVPLSAIAVKVAYDADLLATEDPTTPAAVDQGEHVAAVLVACVLGAAALRALLLLADRRVARLELKVPRRTALGGALAGVALVAIVLVVAGAPGYVSDQYDGFVNGNQVAQTGDFRDRLTDPGNNGRLFNWNAALDGFEEERLHGVGAGAYQLLWERRREEPIAVVDAHGLFFEVMGELGIVGLLLLVAAVGTILVGLAVRARGRSRTAYAAMLAVAVCWTLDAAIDWQWEMPAVTLVLFAGCAAAIGRRVDGEDDTGPSLAPSWRVPLAVLLLAAAVVPVLLMISQARLQEAADAFGAGDCEAAVPAALDATDVLSARPEPYEIIGYCQVQRGFGRQGARAMEQAVEHDPNNWEYHYGLAVARATAGLDPRPDARRALAENPREPIVRELVESMDGNGPDEWPKLADEARLRIYESGLLSLP